MTASGGFIGQFGALGSITTAAAVGTAKPVTVNGLFIVGNSGSLAVYGYQTVGSSPGSTFGGSSVTANIGTITAAPLTITANPFTKTFDAVAYSGGNGVTYSGFVGGEGTAVLGGTLGYGGTSQGAVNAGTYSITPQGLTSNNYAISAAAERYGVNC